MGNKFQKENPNNFGFNGLKIKYRTKPFLNSFSSHPFSKQNILIFLYYAYK